MSPMIGGPKPQKRDTAAADMAAVVTAIAGAPGVEHRGVEFWVAVARNVCARHGVASLAEDPR